MKRIIKSGFTLVELLTVIIIIGLLAAILLPTITSALKTGYGAQGKARVESLARGAELYKREFGLYPAQGPSCRGMLDAQTYSGSQILASALYCYDVAVAGETPKSGYDSYREEYLQTLPVAGGATRSRVLSDGFPAGKALAILYFPSCLATFPTELALHYRYDDNKVHTSFAPVNNNTDEAGQRAAFSGSNTAFIVDPRLNRTYCADEFIIVAPGADRKYFTPDDAKNF